uniref:Uncharacterized protein n=1 Tax=Suricata suricatta TaxID=37032 RepID=A0A673UCS1_SURSU
MQYAAFFPSRRPLPLGGEHFLGGPMSSPTTARVSASVPTAASPAPEVTVARVSVSSPTWSSRCSPAETLDARRGPEADKAASPREDATTAKPPAASVTPHPIPAPSPVSIGPGAGPATAMAPAADLTDANRHTISENTASSHGKLQ